MRTSLVCATPATVSGPCMLYLYLWLSSVMYVTWHGALLLGLCFTQGVGAV